MGIGNPQRYPRKKRAGAVKVASYKRSRKGTIHKVKQVKVKAHNRRKPK